MYREICLTWDTLFLLVAVRLPSVFTEPLKICTINLSRVRFRAVLIENLVHRRASHVISPGTCEQNKKRGWKKHQLDMTIISGTVRSIMKVKPSPFSKLKGSNQGQ
ncbi:hypothetical protein Peur_027442 [Populus x canadensis]